MNSRQNLIDAIELLYSPFSKDPQNNKIGKEKLGEVLEEFGFDALSDTALQVLYDKVNKEENKVQANLRFGFNQSEIY